MSSRLILKNDRGWSEVEGSDCFADDNYTPGGGDAFNTLNNIYSHEDGCVEAYRKDYSELEEEYHSQEEREGYDYRDGPIEVFQDGFQKLVEYSSHGGELFEVPISSTGCLVEEVLGSKSVVKSNAFASSPDSLGNSVPDNSCGISTAISPCVGSIQAQVLVSVGNMECQRP